MPEPGSLQLVSCVAAVLVAVASACGLWLVRGTTAVPAAGWCLAAAGLFAVEMAARWAGGLGDPAALAAVRLVAVSLMLCPIMSLLGAKRPQHGVWQFIVGSFAAVLALPALSAALVRPGSLPDVHGLQRWFMPLVVAVAWMNHAGTGRGGAAACVAAGQMLLLRPFLPFADAALLPGWIASDAAGSGLVAAGAILAVVQSVVGPVGGPRAARSAGVAGTIDAPFLAIRETLGAAWTLRIAERFNQVAATRGWPCRLRFAGLALTNDDGGGPWQRDAERCAAALLRRFASAEWLRRHASNGVCPGDRGPEVAPPVGRG